MILVLDNYDSFTYNLVQYLGELNVEMQVRRNAKCFLGAMRLDKKSQRRREPVRSRQTAWQRHLGSSARRKTRFSRRSIPDLQTGRRDADGQQLP